jgi:hypothetical protein
MLIHDRFIFLHVPRTGGIFLRDVLKRELPPGTVRRGPRMPSGRSGDGTHTGRLEIPEALRGRPVLAFIRNPWDWYVSIYHYVMKHSSAPIPDPVDARMLAAIFGDYTYDFAEMVRTACGGGNFGFSEAEASEIMKHSSPIIHLLFQGYDLYTAFTLGVVGMELLDPALTMGRYESLFDDLERFFAKEEIVVADGAFSRMREANPTNASAHRPYREYYDDDLRGCVGTSCALILERFDYNF